LQTGGFDAGSIKAEPKATAEAYARLKAETTAAEVKLQVLRQSLTENSVEIQQLLNLVGALKRQLVSAESSAQRDSSPKADYVSRYREYKYQESLYELFSKQYEIARLDESREGALIQVVDVAMPADLKSRPGRSMIAVGVTMATFVLYLIGLYLRETYCRMQASK
jgi:uncharacterized protein involved in exopolysaccharide biosynthesis